MDFRTPSTRRLLAGRLFAIAAMFVLLFGRIIHLNQECGDCCSVSCSHDYAAKASPKQSRPCPFGCCHDHEQPAPHEKTDESRHDEHPTHDESHCAVCSVFAQAPSCVSVVGLPAESDVVVDTITFESASVAAVTMISAQSRGPPCVA